MCKDRQTQLDPLRKAKQARQAHDRSLIDQGLLTWKDCFAFKNVDFTNAKLIEHKICKK